MVRVENLRAIKTNGDKKAVEVEYLGCLLWYTVSNVLKIPIEQLEQELKTAGLEKFMPRKINPRDAFRRVTKAMEVHKEQYGQDTYMNLLVRDVRVGEGEVVRQLVREVVDGKNTRLEYKPVLQLSIGDGSRLAITPLVDYLTPTEQRVVENLPKQQEEACQYFDGVHVRYMLWKMLQECNTISVRPNGGVDFIQQTYVPTVEKIKELSKNLNKYEGNVRIWSIPVIDAAEHREMIQESLEEQVIGSSNALIHEMKTIKGDSSKNLSVKAIQGYADRVRKLKILVKEYEESLEFQAINAQENLKLAMQLTVKLMEESAEV